MILPISKAFQALKTRIDCIANHQSGELPLATYNKKNSQTIFFFGEDYLIQERAEDAKQASNVHGKKVLSLEECLNCFDERLLQCQEYGRDKVKKEQEMREMSKQQMNKQIDQNAAARQRSNVQY